MGYTCVTLAPPRAVSRCAAELRMGYTCVTLAPPCAVSWCAAELRMGYTCVTLASPRAVSMVCARSAADGLPLRGSARPDTNAILLALQVHKVKRVAVFGGSLQILLSMLIGLCIAAAIGAPLVQGFFVGAFVSMSSTTVVLKCLMDHSAMNTHHGQ
eukprot:7873623-Pyramimonas_sp.AAC.1